MSGFFLKPINVFQGVGWFQKKKSGTHEFRPSIKVYWYTRITSQKIQDEIRLLKSGVLKQLTMK